MYVLWVPPFNSGVSLIRSSDMEGGEAPTAQGGTDVSSSTRNTRASFQRWEPHRKEMEENQQARILRAWQGLRLSSPGGGGGGWENRLHSQVPYNKNCKTELLRPPNVEVPNASLQTDVVTDSELFITVSFMKWAPWRPCPLLQSSFVDERYRISAHTQMNSLDLKELQESVTLPGLISFLNLKDAISELSNCWKYFMWFCYNSDHWWPD